VLRPFERRQAGNDDAVRGRPLMAAIVSLDCFEALAMALGRGLGDIDATGAGHPAVLSHQAWTRIFDRDPSVLSRSIELNGQMYTVATPVISICR